MSQLQPAGYRQKAFTLIEVLVALALFAAVAAMLAQTCANLLQSQWALRPSNSSDAALEQWTVRHLLQLETREELEDGGRLELPDGSSVNWRSELVPSGIPDLFILNLQLARSGGESSSASQQLQLHLYRPGWMTPREREPLVRERGEKWQDWARERDLPLQ